VILGDKPDRARRYAKILQTPFPILADPDRDVYEQFGLEKALLVIQRTASLVVDRQGVIRYVQRATNPLIWLQDIRELVDFVKTLNKGNQSSPAPDDE